jgi:hypothetical protein
MYEQVVHFFIQIQAKSHTVPNKRNYLASQITLKLSLHIIFDISNQSRAKTEYENVVNLFYFSGYVPHCKKIYGDLSCIFKRYDQNAYIHSVTDWRESFCVHSVIAKMSKVALWQLIRWGNMSEQVLMLCTFLSKFKLSSTPLA